MKRYKFSEFYIELTRRCNEHCEHCVRGYAQDLTITKEIIDKLFEDTEECLHVYITGGEPLLEPDILLYLIDKIAKNWNTVMLTMTTNGSLLNKKMCPVRTSKYERQSRTAVGHVQWVEYIAAITI